MIISIKSDPKMKKRGKTLLMELKMTGYENYGIGKCGGKNSWWGNQRWQVAENSQRRKVGKTSIGHSESLYIMYET